MRILKITTWGISLSLLFLDSEDEGAQKSSKDELRKHNENDLKRKKMQVKCTEVVSRLQATRECNSSYQAQRGDIEIRYTKGTAMQSLEILPSFQ
jgi:hypothetical protein